MVSVLGDVVINAGSEWSNKISTFHNDETMTYREVLHQSRKLSSFMRKCGIQKGNRVCFCLEKRMEQIVSILGITLSGGVSVPVRRNLHVETVCLLSKINNKTDDSEFEKSSTRAEQMKKNKELLEQGADSELARILAEIDAKNKGL